MSRHTLFAIFFVSTLPLAAADEWIKLTTPHFELFTTAGEKKGREAILYFEQVRGFFLQASPSKHAPDAPVRIVAFRSEKQYKPYRINEVAFAYYLKTQMRDYIVMQDISSEHYQVAIHEYTHLIAEHAGLKLPVWLSEGWADLYSTLRPNGKKVLVGDILPGRAQTLFREKWIDLGTLTSVQHDSPFYNEKDRAGMFYAESWFLTHMLYLSDAYRPNFTKFVVAVNSGKDTASAFESVYNRTLPEVQSDLRKYMKATSMHGVIFDIKLEKSEEEATAETPSAFDVDLSLADLLAAGHKTDQAKQEYQRLARENPGKPDVEESLGYMLWQEHDRAGAREHFAKAVAAGSHNARMCFDYAMLEQGAGGDLKSATNALERTVELKPDYPNARLQLGLMLLNDRQYGRALIQLTQIHKVDPDQAPWLFAGLAHAFAQTGDLNQARINAEKAKQYAQTPEQTNNADELLRYLDAKKEMDEAAKSPPAQSTTAQANAETSQALTPAVAPNSLLMRAEGEARKLECDGKGARLHVTVGHDTMVFKIDDPAKVTLKHSGEGTFEFQCGPQKPFHVVVDYLPEADKSKRVAGLLRILEF
jgi:Tfp pilus assembly protein PilF